MQDVARKTPTTLSKIIFKRIIELYLPIIQHKKHYQKIASFHVFLIAHPTKGAKPSNSPNRYEGTIILHLNHLKILCQTQREKSMVKNKLHAKS